MRILLSIKAVLNYLYNNLIDLIWVRVLRFSDGTEMTTVPQGNNLYDIKLLSQVIADKGWAFMCHTNRRDLAKTDVPTLYNDIKFKYDNADMEYTSAENTSDRLIVVYDKFTQKYYFYKYDNGNKIYTSIYPDLSNPTLLTTLNSTPTVFIVGQNIIILSNGQRYFDIYDKNLNYITTYDYSIKASTNTLDCWKYVDGNFIFSFHDYILKITDNQSFTTTWSQQTFIQGTRKGVRISDVINGYIYITYIQYGVKFVKININDFNDMIVSGSSDLPTTNINPVTNLFNVSEVVYFEDYFYISCLNKIFKSQDLVNWEEVYTSPEMGWRIVKNNNNFFILGYGYIISTNNFSIFTNVLTFTQTLNMGEQCSINFFVYNNNNSIIISSNRTDNLRFYLYSAPTIKVYTDTYTINGSTVAINYYKYNDFKICLSDGGTNDSNLETVYSYLGYLNYWIIDTANETVAIQRNKQPFVCMFVGDDFQDDLLDLPTQSVRCLPQAQEIIDSSASVSLDILSNKDYKLTNINLSSLTLNSCQDSPLGTTIQFKSGATPTTITDNTNIEWVDGATPIPSTNVKCLIFVWNNIGFYKEW